MKNQEARRRAKIRFEQYLKENGIKNAEDWSKEKALFKEWLIEKEEYANGFLHGFYATQEAYLEKKYHSLHKTVESYRNWFHILLEMEEIAGSHFHD